VKTCKTADYASGHAPKVCALVIGKYAPKLAPRKLELKAEFQRSCLKSGKDPEKWITKKLEGICLKLRNIQSDIMDEDFFVHILNYLPNKYKVQISKLEDSTYLLVLAYCITPWCQAWWSPQKQIFTMEVRKTKTSVISRCSSRIGHHVDVSNYHIASLNSEW